MFYLFEGAKVKKGEGGIFESGCLYEGKQQKTTGQWNGGKSADGKS